MALKIGSLMISVNEVFEVNFGISSFFTIFENKLFKVSAFSDLDVIIFHFQSVFSLWILTCQSVKV